MLVLAVANEAPQGCHQFFIRSLELRWLLDRESASRAAESRHTLVDQHPDHLGLFREQLPHCELKHCRSLRMLLEELASTAELDEGDLSSDLAERHGDPSAS